MQKLYKLGKFIQFLFYCCKHLLRPYLYPHPEREREKESLASEIATVEQLETSFLKHIILILWNSVCSVDA